jgi:SH3 domain protein
MKMLTRWLGLALLGAALGAGAQERYIDDTLLVPLRTGSSTEHRIVHQGIASGTAVTVVEDNREVGWSLVRTQEGIEGWLPTRYLKREPGARYQLASALRALGQPDDGSTTLASAIEQVQTQLAAVITERDRLQAELAEGRQVWSNADELDAQNQRLTEEVQSLKNRMEVLEAENRRLNDDTWQKWFINGVWATGIGGVLTLLLPKIFSRRRRYSEWS